MGVFVGFGFFVGLGVGTGIDQFTKPIVADSRSKRDGRCIEEIGTYDPNQEPSVCKVDEEAAKKWLANGAQPTEVVAKILKQAGIEK